MLFKHFQGFNKLLFADKVYFFDFHEMTNGS